MTRPYSYQISHDGRGPVTIRIPDLEVVDCANPDCPGHASGESMIFDDAATHRITIETYRQLGLLTPEEIRAGRKKLGLKQSELQELLGLGGNSLSRWEKARVYQSRAMNKLLRMVFEVPEVLEYLQKESARSNNTISSDIESIDTSQFKYLPSSPKLRNKGFSPRQFLQIAAA